MELNKYSMYNMQYGICNLIDEVDKITNELDKINKYEEIEKYVYNKWDITEEMQRIDFDKSDKFLYVCLKHDAIELFEMKNDNEVLWSKGWRKIKKD